MKKKSGETQESKALRLRAEQQMAVQTSAKIAAITVNEKKLLHELQVHQIELELQNEALQQAKTLLEISRDEYQNRFTDLYDFAPVGYLSVNCDQLITEINLTAASMLGIERSNLMLQHFPQWIAEESRDAWQRKFLRLKQNSGKQQCELIMRRSDASSFIARVDCCFMTCKQQPSIRIALTDVTQQKLNEQQLLQSQLFAVNIVESVMDAIITINADQRIVLFNRAAEKMFGYPADQVIGDTLDRFIPERFRHAHPIHINAFSNTGATDHSFNHLRDFIGLRANGEEFPVEVSISKTGNNADKSFTAILRDISERKLMEARQLESQRENQFLADLIRTSPLPMAIGYQDGRVGLVNSAFEKLTGYGVEELAHINWVTDLTPPEWFAIEHDNLAKLQRIGDSIRYEKEYFHKNGNRVPVELLVHFKADCEGKPELYYAFISDITERKRAEQEQQSATLRKDEFLAMLAHELRNPLAPISNAVHILKRGDTDPDRINWCTDIIDRQLEHLTRLVDDLLDLSRISRGVIELKPEMLEIRDFLLPAIETCQSLIDMRRQKFYMTLPPQPVYVEGDRIRLTQVILNLINNAAKYTQEGGNIRLSVEPAAEQVCIRVRDNGRGIDSTDLTQLFDLFYQNKHCLDHSQGGLGIGLFLVKRLAEKHGGDVQAFSEGCGQGSEFVVYLPVHMPKSLPAVAAKQTASASILKQFQILLVEDNPDIADSMALVLRLDGHTVRIAQDGATALEMVQVEQPDVIVLDIGLPGMDGYSLAQALRQNSKLQRTLLIALTGYGRPQDKEKSRVAGIDVHLVKPPDIKALRKLLNDYSVTA